MEIYQVGGSVRDEIIGRKFHDIDYVVVGSCIDEMKKKGFIQVGKSFPVFLKNGCEYALARKEKKTGKSHKDFLFEFSSDITLKDDLSRRDFTINTIAKDSNGKIYDFFGGLDDIKAKKIRHINNHFKEDPLRVLRACRLAAELNFTIDRYTMRHMKNMVKNGCIENLSAERIWKEFERALYGDFYKFIKYMIICGALQRIIPEFTNLKESIECVEWHPEGNTLGHCLTALKYTNKFCPNDYYAKFAVMLHDIGKGVTPKENYPHHYEHDELGVDIVKNICKRMKTPNKFRDYAVCACKNHMKLYRVGEMRYASIYDLAKELDGKMSTIFNVCLCDAFRGKKSSIEYLRGNFSKIEAMNYCIRNVHFSEIKNSSKLKNPHDIKKALKDYTIIKFRREFYDF